MRAGVVPIMLLLWPQNRFKMVLSGLMGCWGDFQRWHTKVTSHGAEACSQERTLASTCIRNKSPPPLPTKGPRRNWTWILEPFQEPRVHCPGRSDADAPSSQMAKFSGPTDAWHPGRPREASTWYRGPGSCHSTGKDLGTRWKDLAKHSKFIKAKVCTQEVRMGKLGE